MLKHAKKKWIFVAALVLFVIIAVEFLIAAGMYRQSKAELEQQTDLLLAQENQSALAHLHTQGFVNLNETMHTAGYTHAKTADHTLQIFESIENAYEISFDFENKKIKKDLFGFEIPQGASIYYQDNYYVQSNLLGRVIGRDIRTDAGETTLAVVPAQSAQSWIKACDYLMTHAGGILRQDGELYNYTNGVEAIVQNYDLGARVFELDIALTSDNEIACMHDWKSAGFPEGPPTAQVWRQHKYKDMFTTYFIEDIYRLMAVSTDIYIIPDPKIYDMSREDIQAFFSLMVEKAEKFGPDIADRIIPAIYNQEMYGIIKEVYDFPSIIYTIYATKDTYEEIVEFVKDKEDIPVVLAPQSKWSREFPSMLAEVNKMLFIHTVNDTQRAKTYMNYGTTGFLSDYFTPSAMKEIMRSYDIELPAVAQLSGA